MFPYRNSAPVRVRGFGVFSWFGFPLLDFVLVKSDPATVNTDDLTITWEGDFHTVALNGRYKIVQAYNQTVDPPHATFAVFFYPSNGTTDVFALVLPPNHVGWYTKPPELFSNYSIVKISVQFPIDELGDIHLFGVQYHEE